MAKYSKLMADTIVSLYRDGKHGIKEICEAVDISQDTFHQWKKDKPYFSDALSNVQEQRLYNIGEMAISGLAKLVDIYEYEEKRTDYMPGIATEEEKKKGIVPKGKVKMMSITKKIIMPSNSMIQYALNNLRSDRFKTASSIDHTTKGQSLGFGEFLQATKPKLTRDAAGNVEETEEEVYVPTHRMDPEDINPDL